MRDMLYNGVQLVLGGKTSLKEMLTEIPWQEFQERAEYVARILGSAENK